MGRGLRPVAEVFFAALRLGLTSFGGPTAHFAYFRQEYVVRRRWVDDATFSELLVLAQVLPGPSSSQLGMAIGHLKAGWVGAGVAWAGFTLPSALLMILAASVWTTVAPALLTVATHGLLLVAVAVVAQAVGQLYRSQCTTPWAAVLAWGSFAAVLVVPGPATMPAALALGALAGALRGAPALESFGAAPPAAGKRRLGLLALVMFGFLALGLPWLRSLTSLPWLDWADAFYRTGSWVFGGGHVVLPWLDREVIQTGWVSREAFLAGYGAAQALPGPLFSFAAFLGMTLGGLPGALVALVAIFLPGFLLIGGVLPFWSRLRLSRRGRGALGGASAAVVGILAAALVSPLGQTLVRPADWALAAGLLLGLQVLRWPAWVVVLVGALAGPLVLLLQ